MASATEGEPVPRPPMKRSLLDLPSETVALIFENTTDHDLAQLCRVSKHVRELAAAELYHTLNHTFNVDAVSTKRSIDYLASYLETLATSDYNYAGHVKEIFVDTGHTAGKGEQACRQFFYDLTCGKFFNTLLLAVLKRTRSLEGLFWNVRIELSTAVFAELHRMPNLRRVRLRLQAGQSLHAISDTSTGLSQPAASVNGSPISPGAAPGTHSPSGGWGFPTPAPAMTTLRMVSKLPATKPISQPASFSGFKSLKSLCALEIDSLDYIPEIAESVRNSLETLKQLEISLSDTLARRAREKPRADGSDGVSSDDVSTVASQSHNAADDSAPSGSNPEQTRQWHKSRQEAILSKILAPAITTSNAKEAEAATDGVLVSRAEGEAQNEMAGENNDLAKDDDDKVFVKMMRAIFREARFKQDSSSKGAKTMEKIEKAATKYLEGRPKAADVAKVKPASKSSVITVKIPKPPAPGNLFQGAQQSNSSYYKTYSVHENVVLDYFGFPKAAWDQLSGSAKNKYVQTYFKETEPYSIFAPPPPLPGKSATLNKVYHANTSTVPGHTGPPKYVVIPHKKSKLGQPPKPKHASDSDDPGKASKPAPATGGESSLFLDPLPTSPAKVEKDDLSEDPEMLFPDENEDEGPDQQFDTEDEASGDEGDKSKLDMEALEEGINGAIMESGWLAEDDEAPTVTGKGKQAVRDPPNGHLTPPQKPSQSPVATPEAAGRKKEQEDAVSKYIRLSHGLCIERLAIYLVPVKPATFLHHFDMYALKNLILLNVGSQRRIWATLTKLQRQSPLPLSSLYTDNVTPSLLTFLASLEAGQLEELFLLERYLRRKGRLAQLADCDKTTVEIDAIRKQVLQRHMPGLKKLMIRNDDSESWAMRSSVVRLISREGVKLRELAVQCDTFTFHALVRSLPYLPELYALQITFILEASTPPVSMTGPAVSISHHHFGGDALGSIEPHTPASATMLHELRQCVVDTMGLCKDSTQLEMLGFSWSTSGRGGTFLDPDGNPYVFLSRLVKDVDGEDGECEWSDIDDDVDVDHKTEADGPAEPSSSSLKPINAEDVKTDQTADETETAKATAMTTNATTGEAPKLFYFWTQNDLSISEVQDVRMWDKETWAGRL